MYALVWLHICLYRYSLKFTLLLFIIYSTWNLNVRKHITNNSTKLPFHHQVVNLTLQQFYHMHELTVPKSFLFKTLFFLLNVLIHSPIFPSHPSVLFPYIPYFSLLIYPRSNTLVISINYLLNLCLEHVNPFHLPQSLISFPYFILELPFSLIIHLSFSLYPPSYPFPWRHPLYKCICDNVIITTNITQCFTDIIHA